MTALCFSSLGSPLKSHGISFAARYQIFMSEGTCVRKQMLNEHRWLVHLLWTTTVNVSSHFQFNKSWWRYNETSMMQTVQNTINNRNEKSQNRKIPHLMPTRKCRSSKNFRNERKKTLAQMALSLNLKWQCCSTGSRSLLTSSNCMIHKKWNFLFAQWTLLLFFTNCEWKWPITFLIRPNDARANFVEFLANNVYRTATVYCLRCALTHSFYFTANNYLWSDQIGTNIEFAQTNRKKSWMKLCGITGRLNSRNLNHHNYPFIVMGIVYVYHLPLRTQFP